jgi:hypothetical protein
MTRKLLWTAVLGLAAYAVYALYPDLQRELKMYSM